MDLPELGAHVLTELGVQAGERLVEKEQLRIPDDCPGQRYSLLLAAGQLARQAVQQGPEADQVCRPAHARRDVGQVESLHAHAERDVVEHRHVRIERVGLKHHRHVAIARGHVVDHRVPDSDDPLGHILEPGEQPEGGRLSAA